VEAALDALLDRLQPGYRDLVIERRFLPRLVVASDIPSAARGGLAGRPAPRVPDARGLFVAGDWVGPEGCLADAALASARAAAEALAA
jgi:phytoene dehydrogenase-like protein